MILRFGWLLRRSRLFKQTPILAIASAFTDVGMANSEEEEEGKVLKCLTFYEMRIRNFPLEFIHLIFCLLPQMGF